MPLLNAATVYSSPPCLYACAMWAKWRLLMLALVACISVIPYLFLGYSSGHDFRFHVPSWMQLAACWRAGQWLPGWAAGANYGFGDTRFCMYPPLSFILGALLCIALPLRVVPAVFIWRAFFVGGCSMYAVSGEFVNKRARMHAAILYMLSPYLITTALVRFAAAELLTFAWLPLVGLFFYRALWHRGQRNTLILAGLLALTWLTNIPASVVLLYGMAASAMVASVLASSPWPLIRFTFAELISGALAAWYLLPVLRESKWINSAAAWKLNNYQANFLFTPASQLLLPSFSYICWSIACLGTAAILYLACRRWRSLRHDEAAVTWISLAVCAFLFQLPFTAILWAHLPELRYADFPYRFLSLTSLALPLLLLSGRMPQTASRPVYVILALLGTLPFLQFAYTSRTLARLPAFQSLAAAWTQDGYWGSPELVPAYAQKPLHSLHLPPISVAAGQQSDVCTLSEQASGGGTYHQRYLQGGDEGARRCLLLPLLAWHR